MKLRKGYGIGKGQGYKNMMLMDSHIHSLSAKGVKTRCMLKMPKILKLLKAMGNLTNYVIDSEYSVVVWAEDTKTGFRHLAKLMQNGREVDTAKAVYYNRTWERYNFQTVIHNVIRKHFDEKKAEEKIKLLEKKAGLYRVDAKDKKSLYAKRDLLAELSRKGVKVNKDLIRLLKRRLNDNKITQSMIFLDGKQTYVVAKDLEKQGFDYLMNLWKTPLGVERKNNPFGFREETILKDFDHFELREFFDTATGYAQQQGIHYYKPVWTVISKTGEEFDYYWTGDGIIITG